MFITQCLIFLCLCLFQKPANILVMGEGLERGRVKIGKLDWKKEILKRPRLILICRFYRCYYHHGSRSMSC